MNASDIMVRKVITTHPQASVRCPTLRNNSLITNISALPVVDSITDEAEFSIVGGSDRVVDVTEPKATDRR